MTRRGGKEPLDRFSPAAYNPQLHNIELVGEPSGPHSVTLATVHRA